MSTNYGKQFEAKLKEDFLKLTDVSIDRLYDQTSGYISISNISDFIAYHYPHIFYLECKSIHGNTFPLSNLTQYKKLIQKAGILGVRTGVVIWFVDHDSVIYVPIKTIEKMKADGLKSVNIRKISHDEYNYVDIPSTKRKVFMDSDYSVLFSLPEGW